MSVAISIMSKAPEPGRVKTRLCPPLKPEQAAVLAAAFLLDTWRCTHELDDVEVLMLYAGDRTRFPAPLAGLAFFLQRGEDLGARIEHAARLGLSRHEQVIVLGGDLPGLPASCLREAQAALATHDAVLGPSSDGGFYLLGLRACPPGLLQGLAWSVPETMAVCQARLERRQLRVAQISTFDDVDEIDDLRRLARQLEAGALVAPATAAVLERMACV
ncbi:TIGR04282 family arsenosugar biosynthesis glycosyltransferase [Haliangium sp.]|uniref:TIGR04282 family arsenosugar biosynthesis glycosyltransferase n=1 Tax=Haliangium sp. TaxID=2663208 RepID=UPI003D1119E9